MIISASKLTLEPNVDMDTFDRLACDPGFSDIEKHPTYCQFGRRYFVAASGDKKANTSFIVMSGEYPALIAACAADEEGVDHWGLPLRLYLRSDLATSQIPKVIDLACYQFEELARYHGSRTITIYDEPTNSGLSELGERLLARGYCVSAQLNGLCTIGEGEAAMRRGLRKSFKSLVNWGRDNLSLSCINKENPDRNLFWRYRDLHHAVTGRATRPGASWDVMFEQVAAGHGELLLSELSGKLVGGTLVLDGRDIAVYASGAYVREHFDKPIAHWPLWLAMLNASKRGRSVFSLGELPPKGTVSEKEYAIGYFKRGFASSISISLRWTTQCTTTGALATSE